MSAVTGVLISSIFGAMASLSVTPIAIIIGHTIQSWSPCKKQALGLA